MVLSVETMPWLPWVTAVRCSVAASPASTSAGGCLPPMTATVAGSPRLPPMVKPLAVGGVLTTCATLLVLGR